MRITPELRSAVSAAAAKYHVPIATIMAVVEVESAGQIYASVNGTDEPVVRFEGHYFDKRLNPEDRARARALGLSAPRSGVVKNPAKQADRWAKLINPAVSINAEAAFESVSWGVGQCMGSHWKTLSFASAADLAAHARSGISGQVDLMMRYCDKFELIDELQRGDFAGFARGYNGSGYRKNKYDTRMRAAAARYTDPLSATGTASKPLAAEKASTMLRMGTDGARVRVAQSLLVRAGYSLTVDGDYGPATAKAVRAFQKDRGLDADGLIGPETWRCLEDYKATPEERPGVPNPAEAIVATPEGREGAASVGAGVTVEVAKEAVQGAADNLMPVTGSGGTLDWIYTALTVAAVLLTVGGIAWALYGWARANRTRGEEGTWG